MPEAYGWTKGYVCQWKSFDALMGYRADVEDSSPETANVLKHFREEMEPLINAHHAAIVAADQIYVTALIKEIEAATKRNDATLALALEKEIALVKKETPIPADDDETTPTGLSKLRKTHREQCWKADDERNRKAPAIVRRYDPFLDKCQTKVLHEESASKAMEVKFIRQSMQGLLALQ